MDVRPYAGPEQAVDGLQGVGASIPAHRHSPAVLLAEPGKLQGHPKAGGGEVRHDTSPAAELQDFGKVLMLVRVAAAAERDLIGIPSALPDNLPEILQRHIGGAGVEAVLVALHPRLQTQAGLAVDAVAHDAHIQEFGEGGHKWVLRSLLSVLKRAGADILPCRFIENGYEILIFPYPHIGNHLFGLIVQVIVNYSKGIRVGLLQCLPQLCKHIDVGVLTAFKTDVTESNAFPFHQSLPDLLLVFVVYAVVVEYFPYIFFCTFRGQFTFPQQLFNGVFEDCFLLLLAESSPLRQDKAAAAGVGYEIASDFHFVGAAPDAPAPHLLFSYDFVWDRVATMASIPD